jgi:hypothetical protein
MMSYRIVAKDFALEVDNEQELSIALKLVYTNETRQAMLECLEGSQSEADKRIRRRLTEIAKAK